MPRILLGQRAAMIVRRARLPRIRPSLLDGALAHRSRAGRRMWAVDAGEQASRRADVSITQDLLRGVRQIRANPDRKKLHAELVRTLARLRRAHGATAGTRRGRELAVQGFEATLKGVQSEIDFDENDSGEVAAATRDAARADRYLTRGANRLRAAGRVLGVQIGELNGH